MNARRAWHGHGLGVGGYALLASLATLSPLTSVFILPALPQLAADLDTSLAAVQFAVSAGFIGLSVGLLIMGPTSDRLGRRAPLSVGLILYIALTVLCAFAPDVTMLIIYRLLQGVAGGAVWVIARAVVRDVYPARASARVFSQMAMITGLAPVVAPAIAGQLLVFFDWRGLFVILACFGGAVMVMATVFMRETLPRERRQQGGVFGQVRNIGGLLRAPYFMAFLLLGIVQSTMYFTFVIMSPLVFHGDFGLDAQAFGILFAGAAFMMVLGNQLNVFLLRRWMPDHLLHVHLTIALAGTVMFFIATLLGAPLPVVIATVLLVPFAAGASNATITALGLAPYGHIAGTASALLGACQFAVGALVPPLVSLIGVDGFAMGLTMLATALAAWVIAFVIRRRLRGALADALADADDHQPGSGALSRTEIR